MQRIIFCIQDLLWKRFVWNISQRHVRTWCNGRPLMPHSAREIVVQAAYTTSLAISPYQLVSLPYSIKAVVWGHTQNQIMIAWAVFWTQETTRWLWGGNMHAFASVRFQPAMLELTKYMFTRLDTPVAPPNNPVWVFQIAWYARRLLLVLPLQFEVFLSHQAWWCLDATFEHRMRIEALQYGAHFPSLCYMKIFMT